MSDEGRETQWSVQTGITVTGEVEVKAETEEEARELAKRLIKREPFNYGQITEEFTNRAWDSTPIPLGREEDDDE